MSTIPPHTPPDTTPSTPFTLRGELITLDALLKASGAVPSGGAAKILIAEGGVTVNGEVETRRGRKLRAGDLVQLGAACWRIEAP